MWRIQFNRADVELPVDGVDDPGNVTIGGDLVVCPFSVVDEPSGLGDDVPHSGRISRDVDAACDLVRHVLGGHLCVCIGHVLAPPAANGRTQ